MFLSVIIPVYNAEKYIEECLSSITQQNFPKTEYEIICVNDNSEDSSLVLIEKFKCSHIENNISIFTKENNGVSAARNYGADKAKGDYLWFVDADDFIGDDAFSSLYSIAEKTTPDRIMFSHYEFQGRLSSEELSLKEKKQLKMNANPVGTNIWESIFKREKVTENNIRFREGISYSEDTLFCFEFGKISAENEMTDGLFYFYRRNPFSVTRIFSEEANKRRTESCYRVAKVLITYIEKDKNKFRDIKSEEAVKTLMPQVRRVMINAAKLPGDKRKEILNELKKYGLFPYFPYKNRKDRRPGKGDFPTAYKGKIGILLDILNFYSVTKPGFFALRLFNKLYLTVNKIKHRGNSNN